MSKIVRVVIHDGLLLLSGLLARSDNACFLYLQAPEDWVGSDKLLEPHLEALLEQLYGKNWLEGNEDGSIYRILSLVETVLNPQEVADRVWLKDREQNSSDNFWYYHVTDSGELVGVEVDQFAL